MREETSQNSLICQVENDLLARWPLKEANWQPTLFWIHQIELQLAVAATREGGGEIRLW